MSGNLRDRMNQYYAYFATLRSGLDTQAVWVEPYEDATGAGEMTTASIAVYDDSVTPPVLVGVVGVDILTKDLSAVEPNYGNLLKFLSARSSKCPTLQITDCELELIRMSTVDTGLFSGDDVNQFRCNASLVCPEPEENPCVQARSYEEFCSVVDEWDYSDHACCPGCLSVGAIVGIAIGCAVFVVLAAVIIICIIKKRKLKERSVTVNREMDDYTHNTAPHAEEYPPPPPYSE